MNAQDIENKIADAYLRLSTATTPIARRVAFESLKHWKEQRAPEVVEQIEIEKGLR